MRKYRPTSDRYICPSCLTIYEIAINELNHTPAYCLKCDSPLLKMKYRR